MPADVAVGVDVGGTKILAVALADGPTVLAEAELPTARGVEALRAAIVTAIAQVSAGRAPSAIGVGMPGLVTNDGVLRYGPNLPGVTDTAIAELIRPAIGDIPVVVDNDGNCAAWAEHVWGAGRGVADMVFIGLGTGISCGLVIGGQPVRGRHGFAGEPGHMTMQIDGPRCACGRCGCWEALASGSALGRMAREEAAAGRAPGLLRCCRGDIASLRGEHVTAAAAGDDGCGEDADAARILDRFARFVAIGIANVVNVLDPATVVIGGSVMEAAPVLIGRICAAYDIVALGGDLAVPPTMIPAALGRRAGAIGAALSARAGANSAEGPS